MKSLQIIKKFKIVIVVILGILFGIAASLAAKSVVAEAAMENNVYTEPFNAPYYPGQSASIATTSTTYSTGWQKAGGRWFYMVTGNTYYANGWQPVDGKWYYFDGNGYCVTGWIRTTQDVRWGSNAWVMYYDPVNAWMVTGYQKIDGVGRYFDGQGYLLARLGYQFQVNGETYFVDAAGICSKPYQSEGAPFVNATSEFETLSPDDVISGDYEFQAQINENTTVEPFGFDSSLFDGAAYSDQIYWCNLPDNSLKGKVGAWYRNAGTYAGRSIDVKFIISDYELLDLYGPEYGVVGFDTKAIGIAEDGVRYAECKMEFYDHETGDPVNVKGYATITDVDYAQTCAITSKYDKIYVADDCALLYTTDQSGNPIFADDIYAWTNRDDEDTSGQVLVYFNSGTFSYRLYNNATFWNNDLGNPLYYGMTGGRHPHFTESDVINDPEKVLYSWLGYTATRFARVETPHPPVKTVSDSDETNVQENTLASITEGFSYKISENVPLQSNSKFYYSSYKITDKLEPCLTYMGARVLDDAGKDVSTLYTIENSGQTVTFTCKDPSSSAFYGKNYHYIIDVKVNPDADLDAYLSNGVYIIPNVASLAVVSAYENETYDTNVVQTKLPVIVKDCSLEVTKTSSEDGTLLTDAEFTLYQWDGSSYAEYAKLNNNGDGTYSISGLTYTATNGGLYKVVETKNPQGFQGTFEKEFQITKNGGDAQKFAYTGQNTPEKPKANVTITKIDKATGTLLKEAEFVLYEWSVKDNAYSKEPVQTLVYRSLDGKYYNSTSIERTDENGGWFKVVETKNPDGYTGAWEQEFQIAEANGGTQDFSFTAENTHLLNLTLNKTIYAEDYYSYHGDPSFIFEVSGTDINGNERAYARVITFTEDDVKTHTADDGTVTLSTVIRNIPSGTYTVEEKKVSRYALTNVTAQTDNVTVQITETGTQYGNIKPVTAQVTANLTEKDAEVTFTNRKITWDSYTHTDVKVNSFTIER